MAAVVPSSVRNAGAMGDTTLLVVTLPNTMDDTNTWDSGLGTRVVDYWTADTNNPSTQASVGIAVVYSATTGTGTFTFYPAEDNKGGFLFIRVIGS